jgi:C-terminal processing protease CtpA/Prc
MKKLVSFYLCLTLFFSFFSCVDENENNNNGKPTNDDRIRLKVNQFIDENMSYFYLWKDLVADVKPDSKTEPKAYFSSLLYTDDHWSYITDNADAFAEELNAVGEAFGYELSFMWATAEEKTVLAIVLFVYPNSPAAEAGLKRGDIIYQVDGKELTASNYLLTYSNGQHQLSLAKIVNEQFVTDRTVTLASRKIDQNPTLIHTVIEDGEHKIGYLVYTAFVMNFQNQLEDALREFKSQGITDLILDLRYNGGGEVTSATRLCSAIAPQEVCDKRAIITYSQWNDQCQKELEALVKQEPIRYESMLYTRFMPVDYNLNLPKERVYILGTQYSASASEMVIVGLEPYMEVVLIGEKTHGKYTSMIILEPLNDKGELDKEIANWCIAPVVSKYVNVNGYTDFKGGLLPDYPVDDIPYNGIPLGDTKEPLLEKAISLITGRFTPRSVAPPTLTNAKLMLPNRPAKNNLIMNGSLQPR